jgi:hypothetical protein
MTHAIQALQSQTDTDIDIDIDINTNNKHASANKIAKSQKCHEIGLELELRGNMPMHLDGFPEPELGLT